jgi:hypothetical protein
VSVEVTVAQHAARLDSHASQHERHDAEFGKVWAQIEAARLAREQTNLQIEKLNGNVGALSTNFESLDAFIRGDVRRSFIGLIVVVGVLAACVVLALTGDIAAIHDAAKAALPGGP